MECIITDLTSLCNRCGYYDNDSIVNNGYGCNHLDTSEYEYINSQGNFLTNINMKIAKSFSKRRIQCNRRLAKKFYKKSLALNDADRAKAIKKLGYKKHGKCFSFSCPISWEVDFDTIKNYENSHQYDYIESEEEMPWGFGDELMGIEKSEADKLFIEY